jgi:hypothetical protein
LPGPAFAISTWTGSETAKRLGTTDIELEVRPSAIQFAHDDWLSHRRPAPAKIGDLKSQSRVRFPLRSFVLHCNIDLSLHCTINGAMQHELIRVETERRPVHGPVLTL